METVAGLKSRDNIFKFSEPLQLEAVTPDIKGMEKNKETIYTFSPPLGIPTLPSTSCIATSDNSFIGFGKKFKRSQNEWECCVCMISNQFDVDKCVACETPRKPVIPFNDSCDTLSNDSRVWPNKSASDACVACETKNPVANADEEFKTLAAQQKASKWECSACMAQNSNNCNKCICCDQQKSDYKKVESKEVPPDANKFSFGFGDGVSAPTENDLRKASSIINASSLKGEICQKDGYKFGYWKCNSCKTSNKNEDSNCLTCQTRKLEPQFKFGFTNSNSTQADVDFKVLASQQKSSKWECPACMVQNYIDKSICICCGQPKPNTSPLEYKTDESEHKNTTFTTKYSFGFGSVNEAELRKDLISQSVQINTTFPKENDRKEKGFKFGFTSNNTIDDGFKSLAAQQKISKWECRICMTQNDDKLLKCACCEQIKPGEKLINESSKVNQNESAAGKFSFGFGNGINAPTEEDLKKEMKTKS